MAGFVKFDVGMLDSSVWIDRDVRDVWITALLMCELREFREEVPQLEVNSLEPTGWMIPPGWYGVAHAAGTGIIDRSKVPLEQGMAALVKLGQPDPDSRSRDFDGRRLVRVNGGFVALSYIRFRDKDYGAAERMARFRARQKAGSSKPKQPAARRVSSAASEARELARLGRLASREVKP